MPDADVILELPAAWFSNPTDGDRHRRLYASIWLALSDLGVTVRPIHLPFGADEAPRLYAPDQLVLSFHSRGPVGNVLRLKESYLPPYYTIDRFGYSGFSELARYPERIINRFEMIPDRLARDFIEDIKTKVVSRNLSKYNQSQTFCDHLPDRYVFQPLQTIDDPVASLASMCQFDVLESVAAATEALGWSVVFKRHPHCHSEGVSLRLEKLTAEYPNLFCSKASVHPLIASAEAVIGANSGVLFEALLHGAHVVSFGSSDYTLATTEISRPEQIAAALMGKGRIDRAVQCRFLTWYLQDYCVAADDITEIRARISTALAELGRRPGKYNQEQLELFDHYAKQESIRRQAARSC